MKKLLAAALCLLLILSFAGCGKNEDSKIKTVVRNGVSYTVDTEHFTIQDDKDVYSYSIGRSEITIRYPDGQTYTWRDAGGTVMGITSLDFDYGAHTDPGVLIGVVEESSHAGRPERTYAGLGFILLVAGVLDAVWPDKAWFIGWGWRYKNAEPSDLALGVYRTVGIIAAVIGLVLII